MIKCLFYNGFSYSSPHRMWEIHNTIKWNSKIVDKILICCHTNKDYLGYQILDDYNSTISTILIPPPQFEMDISLQDIFKLANTFFHDENIKIFANLDIILSEQFKDLVVEDDTMMLFTDRNSYEVESPSTGWKPLTGANGLKKFNNEFILDSSQFIDYNKEAKDRLSNSYSTWAWKTPKEIPGNLLPGWDNAEGNFLYNLRTAGYKICSGTLLYPTYHNHLSAVKTERFQTNVWKLPKSQLLPTEILKKEEKVC